MFSNEYIKSITPYLGTDILYWNYVPSVEPIEIYVYRTRITNAGKVIYFPFKYKNKLLKLKAW